MSMSPVAGRDDEHGPFGAVAQLAADGEAVGAGQHQVDDDRGRRRRRADGGSAAVAERGASVGLHIRREAGRLEVVPLELGYRAVVLDDEGARRGPPNGPWAGSPMDALLFGPP